MLLPYIFANKQYAIHAKNIHINGVTPFFLAIGFVATIIIFWFHSNLQSYRGFQTIESRVLMYAKLNNTQYSPNVVLLCSSTIGLGDPSLKRLLFTTIAKLSVGLLVVGGAGDNCISALSRFYDHVTSEHACIRLSSTACVSSLSQVSQLFSPPKQSAGTHPGLLEHR
jgi:hypothetical protein